MESLPNIAEILITAFNSLIAQFIAFVPHLFGSIVILVIGYIVARLVALVVRKVLGRIGFDRIGDKLNEISIVRKLNTRIRLSEIVAKVLYYMILLIFLMAATETLGVSVITSMVYAVVSFIPQLIAAAVMLLVGIFLADVIKKTIVTLCRSFNIPSAKLIGTAVFVFFLIITFITALGQIGIETDLLESSFILIIGGVVAAFAIGYGIASKDVMANMIAGMYSRKKYHEGQLLRLDNVTGRIVKIDNVSVTIQNEETTIILPLQLFQSKKVEIVHDPLP
jgi:hypothetical protein